MCTTEILLTLPAIQSRAKESGDEKSFLSGGWTSTEKFCTVTSAIAGNLKPFFSSSSKNGKQCYGRFGSQLQSDRNTVNDDLR